MQTAARLDARQARGDRSTRPLVGDPVGAGHPHPSSPPAGLSEFRLRKKSALGVDAIATAAFEFKGINDSEVDRSARQLRSAAEMSDMEIDPAVVGAKYREDGTVDFIKDLSRLHTVPAQRPLPPRDLRAIAIDPAVSPSKGR